MSTRGFITFVIDGKEKTTYNHSDSYPSWLGVRMLKWLRETWTEIAPGVRALRVVDESTPPTAEDIQRLAEWSWGARQHGGGADLRPGQQWYDLLHETQGDPAAILAAGVIEDGSTFPQDSLFAEWGYVVDLDAGNFEVYEGFQKSPHRKGRFARRRGLTDGYAPVALRASWPLARLPQERAFLAALGEE